MHIFQAVAHNIPLLRESSFDFAARHVKGLSKTPEWDELMPKYPELLAELLKKMCEN